MHGFQDQLNGVCYIGFRDLETLSLSNFPMCLNKCGLWILAQYSPLSKYFSLGYGIENTHRITKGRLKRDSGYV